MHIRGRIQSQRRGFGLVQGSNYLGRQGVRVDILVVMPEGVGTVSTMM